MWRSGEAECAPLVGPVERDGGGEESLDAEGRGLPSVEDDPPDIGREPGEADKAAESLAAAVGVAGERGVGRGAVVGLEDELRLLAGADLERGGAEQDRRERCVGLDPRWRSIAGRSMWSAT